MLPDGTVDGFVGGVCAESTVRLTGLRLLETGESTLLRITPSTEPPESGEPADIESTVDQPAEVDGLVTVANPCLSGGTLEIFLEAMVPPPLVLVFGDAPVARALAGVGRAVGYEMAAGTEPGQPVAPDTAAVVVASHGRDELPALATAVRAGVPYIALVASRRRGAAVLAELDVSDVDRQRIHSPAGLDIGARTAPEVALSILAEIVASRPAHAPHRTVGAPAPGTAVDPVCGMEVAVLPEALRHEYRGSTWYFCGTGCRTAFADNPERYLR